MMLLIPEDNNVASNRIEIWLQSLRSSTNYME